MFREKRFELTEEQKSRFAQILEYAYEMEMSSKKLETLGVSRDLQPAFHAFVRQKSREGLRIQTIQTRSLLILYNQMRLREKLQPVKELPSPEELYTKENFEKLFHDLNEREKLEEKYRAYRKNWKVVGDLYEDPNRMQEAEFFDHFATFMEMLDVTPGTPLSPVAQEHILRIAERRLSLAASVILEPQAQLSSRPSSIMGNSLFRVVMETSTESLDEDIPQKSRWFCC